MSSLKKNGLDIHESAQRVAPKPRGKCPQCGKDAIHDARPFCSIRCANIDLNRWFSESYVLVDSPD